ncbi:MAG: hypothetical protein M0T81_04230 [Thermoplasmatales archaeon]|nr:hypothetical protein [Candidatus Thermoplasmatota archaeon]MDA8143171.1 hypothetical protein [Thermoplasmatales archaeon]
MGCFTRKLPAVATAFTYTNNTYVVRIREKGMPRCFKEEPSFKFLVFYSYVSQC